MNEKTWERVGAGAGLVFVVLQLGGTFLYPQQPRIDSSATTTIRWVHDNRTALQAGMVLGLFAVIALVWFVGHLRHVLERAEGHAEAVSPMVFGSESCSRRCTRSGRCRWRCWPSWTRNAVDCTTPPRFG
jgi:hypothetical protein